MTSSRTSTSPAWAAVILQHHERMDGSGYPHGLTGENILIEARILAVAESSNRWPPSSISSGAGIEAAMRKFQNTAASCMIRTWSQPVSDCFAKRDTPWTDLHIRCNHGRCPEAWKRAGQAPEIANRDRSSDLREPITKADPMKPLQSMQKTTHTAVRFVLFLFCLLLLSCSTVPEKADLLRSTPAGCLPFFPDRDGWYGGDGAYSISLNDGRVLWLFGDTFVSDEEGRRDRTNMKVVLGTTLAVSTCTADSGFQIRYWLKKNNGEFVSSFGEKEWLWPQDPFLVGRVLYIPLLSIKANPEMPGPFKFEIAGHKLARIENFEHADPNRWTVEYLDLTPGIPKEIRAFATTAVAFGIMSISTRCMARRGTA